MPLKLLPIRRESNVTAGVNSWPKVSLWAGCSISTFTYGTRQRLSAFDLNGI